MTEENKKISFGFARAIKKPVLKPQAKVQDDIEYIECLTDKSIKLVNEPKVVVNGPLVIPLVENSNSWKSRLIEKMNAKLAAADSKNVSTSPELSYKNINSTSVSSPEDSSETVMKDLNSTAISSGNSSEDTQEKPVEDEEIMEVAVIKKEIEVIDIDEKDQVDVSKLKSDIDEKELERQAVLELIQESKGEVKVEVPNTLKIETGDPGTADNREPTLEDYDKVPIEQFGLAMLRGMGWQPDRGIGKNPQLVKTEMPQPRPRGMGLGADKAMKKAPTSSNKKEELKLVTGSYVRLNAGRFQGHYGIVKDFDVESGRVLVKLSLLDSPQSLNETVVDPVSKEEYDKNSKVINISKYEEYKNKNKDLEDCDRVNGHDGRKKEERREGSHSYSREKKRSRSRGRESKHERRDRDRSRSKERSRSKHEKKDRERDRSGDRHKHKKSKHHKKHRH